MKGAYPSKYKESPTEIKDGVDLGIVLTAIQPFRHFVARIFRRKLDNSFNNNFDFINWYLDNDYGQNDS